MTSHFGRLNRDLVGGSLRLRNTLVVDRDLNLCVRNARIAGDIALGGTIQTGNAVVTTMEVGDITVAGTFQTDALAVDQSVVNAMEVGSITVTGNSELSGGTTSIAGAEFTYFSELKTTQRSSIIELVSVYGISELRDVVTTVDSGNVINEVGVNSEYLLQVSASSNDSALLDSAERGRYLPGFTGLCGIGVRFPDAASVVGDQEALWGVGDDNNGFFFGRDGTGNFIEVRRSAVRSKTYQADWNVDTADGLGDSGLTLDMTRGNIYHIAFTWYGYGTVDFIIYISDTGTIGGRDKRCIVHRFRPSNTTSINDPNLPIRASIANNGELGSVPLDLYVGGREYSVEANYRPNLRLSSARVVGLTGIGTTLTPVMSFRRKTLYKGVSVKTEGFDVITDATAIVEVRMNTTLTGASFGELTNIPAAETALEFDESATIATGGVVIYSAIVTSGARNQSALNAFQGSNLDLVANNNLTFLVAAVTATVDISIVARFTEEW